MCGYESPSVRPQLDSCSDPVDDLQVFLKRLRQSHGRDAATGMSFRRPRSHFQYPTFYRR